MSYKIQTIDCSLTSVKILINSSPVSYLTSLQSARLRIVCTAMLCMRGVVSPDFSSNSGSNLSKLRDTSADDTLKNNNELSKSALQVLLLKSIC